MLNVKDEIRLHSLPEDRPVLLWLLEKYHRQSQWRFVSTCEHVRYGLMSYQTRRVWRPTNEGRTLYNHR